MGALDSVQGYVEIGILILSLLVLVPVGWFGTGYGAKLMGMVFAKPVSRRTMLGSRATGGVIGAIIALLLWGGFGGRGVPGPGGKGATDKANEPNSLMATAPAPTETSPTPRETSPSLPPAITLDGQDRQVRVATLGTDTQPPYALDNRFFILLDGPERQPLLTEELVKKLTEWHRDHQVRAVVLKYTENSASPRHSEVRKVQQAVEKQRMKFTTQPSDNGKWVP